MRISPDEFNKKMCSRKGNELLDYVSAVRVKLNKHIAEMELQDIPITPASLKEFFKYGGIRKVVYTLGDLRTDFMEFYHKKGDIGVITARAVRQYDLAISRFVEYMGADVDITKITSMDIENFKLDLLKKYEGTSVACMLSKVRTAFIYGINNDKLSGNPFSKVSVGKKTKDVEKLDDDEVEVIREKSFVGRLECVKDLFLFQCYTALSYVDMANLTQSDIKCDDGIYYIRKPRQKTKVVFFTVLTDEAMEILHKYDYKLPILSNQKYNSYLKEIGDICQIRKPLHSHLARHTCATRLLNSGIPIEIVAKVLGHTNTDQTRHYAKLLDKSVINAFKKLG
jgi:site-specific recombinase XerD